MHPNFWKTKNPLSLLLLPASIIYYIAGYLRPFITKKHHPKIPVICVGNVTAGGAGKTPVVLAISELLNAQGLKTAIASRGYKGDITKPTIVNKNKHTVHSVGDEPLMLARIAPTYIAANRYQAIEMAEKNGADIVIMDDGLQNPTVYKDKSILVIDGKFGIGNGFIMPAGPLRESLAAGIQKADVIILVGDDDTGILKHKAMSKPNKPLIRAKLIPQGDLPDKDKQYIAFAGIGNPDKFFATLAENGYNLCKSVPFPDHYNYSDKDINNLIHMAEDTGAALITTEKDEVRLPLFARKKIAVLRVRIVWEDEGMLKGLLSFQKLGNIALPSLEGESKE